MHRTAYALALVAALAATAHADLPADGILVATQEGPDSADNQTLVIHRVKPTGMERIYESKNSLGRQFAWSDARTLWALSYDDSSTTVEKIVDGKLSETIKVGVADWKVKSLKAGDITMLELLVTKNGQIWLEQCLRHRGTADENDDCVKYVFLRVDTKPFTTASKRPKNLQTSAPLAFPKAKAPAGYKVKLGKVTVDGKQRKGATCTGPMRTATFPDATDDEPFAMKPSKVTWLRSSPAVVVINGSAKDPLERSSYGYAYYVDCQRVLNVRNFGRGLWGSYREIEQADKVTSEWTLYAEDKPLGTFSSTDLEFAPR